MEAHRVVRRRGFHIFKKIGSQIAVRLSALRAGRPLLPKKIPGTHLFFFNWYIGGVKSNWVHSALRPLIGLLCQPRVIMMMEKLVE
jgi:hypothetical protein